LGSLWRPDQKGISEEKQFTCEEGPGIDCTTTVSKLKLSSYHDIQNKNIVRLDRFLNFRKQECIDKKRNIIDYEYWHE
jgi:hypothetical protein